SDPDALAIVAGAELLTYGQLEKRANQLANYLINLGVRSETIVVICLDRSFDSIISAMAVLKAGGAYLPLDPKLPVDRLNFMLRDAQPRVVISKRDLTPGIDSGAWEAIDLETNKEIQNSSGVAPAIEIAKDQLAYVIYTSGSTGQPKGVEITIANLLNLIEW